MNNPDIKKIKAVIIAAGRGSRLDHLSSDGPKCLIDLLGLKIIDRIIYNLIDSGITDIGIVTGYMQEKLISHIKNKFDKNSFTFIYNDEWENRGNGISVYKARDYIDDDEEFILLMSDHIFKKDILPELINFPLDSNGACLVIDRKIEDIFDMPDATKVFTENSLITNIDKELNSYNGVDCGLFKCSSHLFTALNDAIETGEESLSGGIRNIIKSGKMRYLEIGDNYWQDIDHYEGYKNAEKIILDNL